MDGMHCILDGTSILVKITSVALYNCQAVYIRSKVEYREESNMNKNALQKNLAPQGKVTKEVTGTEQVRNTSGSDSPLLDKGKLMAL
jgi:hypothetical protein